MLVRLEQEGRLTIPKELRPGLAEDALFEAVRREDGVIELHPKTVTDTDQAWFWTEAWQKGERQADEDIAAGRFEVFDDVETFLAHLDAIPASELDAR